VNCTEMMMEFDVAMCLMGWIIQFPVLTQHNIFNRTINLV